jgi:hypothetical protein
MKRSSKRFTPSKFTEYLVPLLLILLSLGLVGTMILIGLAVAGVMPGG